MTEPVAYMLSDFVGNDFTSLELPKNPNNPRGLYFKEQLHQRVKMTQAEFDEWFDLYDKKSFLIPINFLKLISNIENGYPLIYNIYLNGRKKQLELLELWLRFKQENPEETIEIVPDMKWFVKSKKRDYDGDYAFLAGIINTNDWIYREQYDGVIGMLYHFETKEEAEKWTNPLTEAVQLPVEGE